MVVITIFCGFEFTIINFTVLHLYIAKFTLHIHHVFLLLTMWASNNLDPFNYSLVNFMLIEQTKAQFV